MYNEIFMEIGKDLDSNTCTVVYYDDMHLERIGRDEYYATLARDAVKIGVVTEVCPKFENSYIDIELHGSNLLIMRGKAGNAYLYYRGGEIRLNGVKLQGIFLDIDVGFVVEFMYYDGVALDVYVKMLSYPAKYCLRFTGDMVWWYPISDLHGYTVLPEELRVWKETVYGGSNLGVAYWSDRDYVLGV